ncbi:uncharacterized protein IUM83_00759 [Phytophthora cinnamomi]|uniref:uncharacterized protein n=1 Tax=Phytophthora cinnamomi TaxID=4785 RepID=UPI0035597467|nr:hypothetical protein IUM83_00759 [Phytophthora cinnamomi]
MPDSPPPPPPPDDEDEEEDEEDSFAEEIRKLRESRRQKSMPVKAPEKEVPKEEDESKISEICATAALKVRNASNAINDLLLEALKPFEDRQREEEKTQAIEKENAGGDSAIRKAAQAELQSATQTIVSQLDLTFADMTERRKADMKTEADAAAAAKDAEKKEKEAAEEKKKTDEKEAKQREMEILRMIPMQGKLLTCPADIDAVLMQLETVGASAPSEPADSGFVMEAEIKALRSHTQRKIEAIEARMAESQPTKAQNDQGGGLSWRAADWVRDNVEIRVDAVGKGENPHAEATANSDVATITVGEEPLQDILQRHVLEKLDLTMLKLKHVLAIDAKESAERQEQQKREEDEQAKQVAQQQAGLRKGVDFTMSSGTTGL